MASKYVTVLEREVHYLEWTPAGPSTEPPIVMWHGLARTSGDFIPERTAEKSVQTEMAVVVPTKGLNQMSLNALNALSSRLPKTDAEFRALIDRITFSCDDTFKPEMFPTFATPSTNG